jgi:hypothetical protein
MKRFRPIVMVIGAAAFVIPAAFKVYQDPGFFVPVLGGFIVACIAFERFLRWRHDEF